MDTLIEVRSMIVCREVIGRIMGESWSCIVARQTNIFISLLFYESSYFWTSKAEKRSKYITKLLWKNIMRETSKFYSFFFEKALMHSILEEKIECFCP